MLNKIEFRVLDRLINGVKDADNKQMLERDPNGSRWLRRSLFTRAIGHKKGELPKALQSVKEQGFVKSRVRAPLTKGPPAEFFCITDEGRFAYSTHQHTLFMG